VKTNHTTLLHEVMADQAESASVLTITSGKGGVGKTNIAANLAICLSAAGKKVLLIDADLGLGNLDVVLGINSRINLLHVMTGSRTLREVIQTAPGGVDVICGGSGFQELAELNCFQRKRLLDELTPLQTEYDIILIDTAAGISKSVIGFCQASDHVLVVTTPEPTAMTDAYAVLKVLSNKQYQGRMSLVVNMTRNAAEGKRVYRQISTVAQRFLSVTVYEAGVLCHTDKLINAVRKRKPAVLCYPKCRFTASMAAMASRLAKGQVADKKEGFFQKVVNLFF